MNLQERCKIINFKDLGDERGKLVVIEGDRPFLLIFKEFFISMDLMQR